MKDFTESPGGTSGTFDENSSTNTSPSNTFMVQPGQPYTTTPVGANSVSSWPGFSDSATTRNDSPGCNVYGMPQGSNHTSKGSVDEFAICLVASNIEPILRHHKAR